MKKYLIICMTLLWLACSDHDATPESFAVVKACKVCQTNRAEMAWLLPIIEENNGNVYAINTQDGVFIVHQPIYMSCMGCIRYTCSGAKVNSVSPAVQEELQMGMKNSNLIYEVKF